MEQYIASTIESIQYSDSTDIEFVVFLYNNSNPNVKLQLDFKNIKTEKEIVNIISEFNNPLRLKNTYRYEDIYECDKSKNGELIVYCTTIYKYSFSINVKCVNKKYLQDFIDFINNPSDVDVDILIKEHMRLDKIIDGHFNSIRELNKQQKSLEYRIWGSFFNNNEKGD